MLFGRKNKDIDIDQLREQLTFDEGKVNEIYKDHLGYPTFGIGHLVLETDPEFGQPVGTPVSEERTKECFEKEYDKVTHHNGIENLYRHLPHNDIAIRFDNCFAPVNLETIFNSDILQIIERTVLQGHQVLFYVPTEPFTKQDLRACSKYLRNNVRNKIHYANCNPNIFNYSDFDM